MISAGSDLLQLLDKLSSARVVIVGDIMLDRFVYGDVERVSPEAPVPVLGIDREFSMLGGAGNVARNVSSLGATAQLVALCGQDAVAKEIEVLLAELPGVEAKLVADAGRSTSVKTRFVAGNQQLLRTDVDDHQPVTEKTSGALADMTIACLENADVLVLSDYAKGVLSGALLGKVINRANDLGVGIVADPKGTDFSKYSGASVLTPNRAELQLASGISVDSDEAAVEAAAHIQQSCKINSVLATRGPEGMTLVSDGDYNLHIPTEAREVFDVSGAGDTVVAALAAAIAAGADLPLASRFANQAAGIVVGKVGTAVAWPDDIVAALHSGEMHNAEVKICTLASAIDRRNTWRQSEEKVVFTNGCFDLVHPGHISLLSQAKGAGDRLVVGLNSDQSVKRLKGDARPVQGEAARATVLASLSVVDLVVVFDEDTPLELIGALKPDVLVKGADYSEDEVVGAKEVRSWGGQVVLAELVDGQSTSNTISRMNKDA